MLRLLMVAAIVFGLLGAWSRNAPPPATTDPFAVAPVATPSGPPPSAPGPTAGPPSILPRNPLSYTVGEVLQGLVAVGTKALQLGGAALAQATARDSTRTEAPPP